jgi:hypothetical protein
LPTELNPRNGIIKKTTTDNWSGKNRIAFMLLQGK